MPGRRLVSLLLALAGALFALAFSNAARAQVGLELRSSVSQPVVEVGQPFSVKLRALVDKGDPPPNDPQLSAPPGFSVQGPSISTQTHATFGSGGSSVKLGIGASWELVASAPGSFVIPAPSVRWNGVRRSAQPLTVEVVPRGSGLAPNPGSSNPFLLPPPSFPATPGWPFGVLEEPEEPDEEEIDSSDALRLAEPLDKNVFLRAVVDKNEVVIGEQITISFYVYYQVDFDMAEPRQAPMSDFVRVPLLNDPGTNPARMTRVGQEAWGVRLIERMAIFPVRAGTLETGSMSARFMGRRIGSRVLRESNSETIVVTEPPAEGRPAGYRMGDVGRFRLEASVQPRQIDQGGAVGVTLKVEGTGNPPSSLPVPARTGIDWLTPAKREQIEPRDGVVGGARIFEYVVRVKESGSVDLGTVELPFFDPETRKYDVATASLGVIDVTPVSPSDEDLEAAKAQGDEDPFAAMPGPRTTLGAFARPPEPLLEGWRWWLAIAAAPMSVGLVWAGRATAQSVSQRRRERRGAWTRQVKAALSEAAAAEKAGDNKALAAAAERSIHAAIEGVTGLKSRGIMLDDLAGALAERGVDPALAEELEAALAASHALRFDPTKSADDARGLYENLRAVVAKLQRAPGATA